MVVLGWALLIVAVLYNLINCWFVLHRQVQHQMRHIGRIGGKGASEG